MEPVPADQKLILEHPELVDPISGVIPPQPAAPAPAPAQPAADSTLPTEEEPAALEEDEDEAPRPSSRSRMTPSATQVRKQTHPARHPQQAHVAHERARKVPKRTGRSPKKR